jgi:hypothetical protein
MDSNTLIFGGLIVVSIAVFLFLGPLRASAKQRDRDDRIDWSSPKYSKMFKVFIAAIVVILIGALLLKLFL